LLAKAGSVAYARFARDGVLSGANARFRGLIAGREGDVMLADLVVEGQRDEMTRLLRDGEPFGEARNVHFARADQAPTTLLVTWAWEGDELILLGESPVADYEATQTALVKLNSRVSELARENAKKSAQLERALDDLRHAQAMLVHREKMAALGQMTAGVAHELNNPLAYVKNNQYLIREGVEDLLGLVNLFGEGLDAVEASQPELFDTIMDRIQQVDLVRLGDRLPILLTSVDEGIDRSVGLVQGLRTFSRLDEAEVKTVDLNDSLRSVVEFAGFLMTENDTEFGADYGDLPPVTCSPGQLNQAVMNILTNAIQAAGPGGKVGLSTVVDGAEALIAIADNGLGVPEEFAARVFDPFFTTRPVGEGTGLGLSIAHTVVSAHNGRIALEPAPGGGAIFIIHLPLGRAAAP
jgi:signal transduction histidine kinase